LHCMSQLLRKAVEEVTEPSKTGCRVVHHPTANTVHVYDLYKWTHDHSAMLQFLCPHAQLSVHCSAQSLSGFMLHIHEHKPERIGVRLAAAAGLLLLLCVLCIPWQRP
jgi:hypothetical protein